MSRRPLRSPAAVLAPAVPCEGAPKRVCAEISLNGRSAVEIVCKLREGVEPQDSPVERPTPFVGGVKPKTGAALAKTISKPLRLCADEVIE